MLASQDISHHKDQGTKGKAVGLFVQCMPEIPYVFQLGRNVHVLKLNCYFLEAGQHLLR